MVSCVYQMELYLTHPIYGPSTTCFILCPDEGSLASFQSFVSYQEEEMSNIRYVCELNDTPSRTFTRIITRKKQVGGKESLVQALLQNLQGKFVSVHAMRAYTGSRDIAAVILNLGTRRRGVVNFIHRPPYSRERTPVPTRQKAGRLGDEKNLASDGAIMAGLLGDNTTQKRCDEHPCSRRNSSP